VWQLVRVKGFVFLRGFYFIKMCFRSFYSVVMYPASQLVTVYIIKVSLEGLEVVFVVFYKIPVALLDYIREVFNLTFCVGELLPDLYIKRFYLYFLCLKPLFRVLLTADI